MKDKNKKTILIIIVILFMSFIITTASYAWFADRSNPSLMGDDMKVAAADGLVIILEPDSAGQSLVNINNLINDVDEFVLKQVSSADANTFYTIDFGNGLALSNPEFVAVDTTSDMVTKGYVDFDFFLATEDYPKHVYIHKDSYITGVGANAIRLSITLTDTSDNTQTIIFGTEEENGITADYTTKAVIQTGTFTYGSIPEGFVTNQLVRKFDYRNGGRGLNDEDPIDLDKTLVDIPAASMVPVNVKIWLEGGDEDCDNTIASTFVDILLKFGSADILLTAPNVSGNSNYTINGLTEAMEWATSNTASTVWTPVTNTSMTFTGMNSVYIRIAEVVGVSPASYAKKVTFN